MTVVELKAYEREIHHSEVLQVLNNPESIATVSVELSAEFEQIRSIIDRYVTARPTQTARTPMDSESVSVIHGMFKDLDKR